LKFDGENKKYLFLKKKKDVLNRFFTQTIEGTFPPFLLKKKKHKKPLSFIPSKKNNGHPKNN